MPVLPAGRRRPNSRAICRRAVIPRSSIELAALPIRYHGSIEPAGNHDIVAPRASVTRCRVGMGGRMDEGCNEAFAAEDEGLHDGVRRPITLRGRRPRGAGRREHGVAGAAQPRLVLREDPGPGRGGGGAPRLRAEPHRRDAGLHRLAADRHRHPVAHQHRLPGPPARRDRGPRPGGFPVGHRRHRLRPGPGGGPGRLAAQLAAGRADRHRARAQSGHAAPARGQRRAGGRAPRHRRAGARHRGRLFQPRRRRGERPPSRRPRLPPHRLYRPTTSPRTNAPPSATPGSATA